MHKYLAVGLLFGLALLIAGCGDDKVTGPTATTPLGFARGEIHISPNTTMQQLLIFGNGAVTPNLDSIKVGDSLISRSTWSMFANGLFADAHWQISFIEDGDLSTLMYSNGDTAEIKVWGERRFSSCRVKLIEPEYVHASITSPIMLADTIAPGQSDTVYWHDIPGVDYYAIMVPWLHYTEGWIFQFHYAADTSFIINGDMMPDSVGQCDVVVTPFNGPDPRTDRTNWTGNLLGGVVYSVGGFTYTSIIISAPPTVPSAKLAQASFTQPVMSSDEIVAKVYEQFRE